MPYPNGRLPNVGEQVTLDGYPDDPGPWTVHHVQRDTFGSWWVRVIRGHHPDTWGDERVVLVSMTTPRQP